MSFLSFFTGLFSKAQSETRFPHVVVGKITAIEPHPNADRLRLATVDIGSPLKLVCGAPNIEVGQFVPVALVGATLPNGMVIKETNIRGVMSAGMLCAADELGVSNDHSGILLLKEAPVGQSIDNYLK
jgi:phenylalanyl-tRNA synthetase beta chain